MTVSKRTLRALAALVWVVGGLILLAKGSGYLARAARLAPASPLPWLGGLAGVGVGAFRGRRAFARGCRKNLARIDALRSPRPWEFFRPGFFAALVAMVAGGIALRRIADGGGVRASLVVGTLELVIALALLTSSLEFWRWRAEPTEAPPAAGDPATGVAGRRTT